MIEIDNCLVGALFTRNNHTEGLVIVSRRPGGISSPEEQCRYRVGGFFE
jgi:hypothetical protein